MKRRRLECRRVRLKLAKDWEKAVRTHAFGLRTRLEEKEVGDSSIADKRMTRRRDVKRCGIYEDVDIGIGGVLWPS